MNWKFWKTKKHAKNAKKDALVDKSKPTVVEVACLKNNVVSERNEAVTKLSTQVNLTPIERYLLLLKTYRHGKDLMVIPEDWKELALVKSFEGKKVFVDTPWPSIVRTR